MVFAVLVAIFAGQNARPVNVTLFFWNFPRVSEALLMLFSILVGVLLSILFLWRTRSVRKAMQTTESRSVSSIDEQPGDRSFSTETERDARASTDPPHVPEP